MDEIYMVYKTDKHHSYASRDVIGVATERRMAVRICIMQAHKEGEDFNDGTLQFLNEKMQTQDYSGEGEFQFEKVQTDILL